MSLLHTAILSFVHPLPCVAWLCMSSAMDSRQPGEAYAPNDNNNHHHKSTTLTRPTASPKLFQGLRRVSSIEYFPSFYFFYSLLTIFCRCHHLRTAAQPQLQPRTPPPNVSTRDHDHHLDVSNDDNHHHHLDTPSNNLLSAYNLG